MVAREDAREDGLRSDATPLVESEELAAAPRLVDDEPDVLPLDGPADDEAGSLLLDDGLVEDV